MGSVKSSSNSDIEWSPRLRKLRKMEQVSKFIDIDYLKINATDRDIIHVVNVLIEDYKARYHE